MFTGIIRKQIKVQGVKEVGGVLNVAFGRPENMELREGKSLSINGICSTIKNSSENDFQVEYMPETKTKTTVTGWKKGMSVNVEESLMLSDFLDGHIVQEHIDTVGKIKKIASVEDSRVISVAVPRSYARFIPLKGSVTLDGVSLTVTEISSSGSQAEFSVSLIPYTLKRTTLGKLKEETFVNVECDVLAKYIDQLQTYPRDHSKHQGS